MTRRNEGRARTGVLHERNARLFLVGTLTSLTGSAMVPVALSFAVLDRGGSASDVGWVLGAETLPLVLLLLVGGVVADRLPRRSVMIGADIVRCGGQALLGGLLLAGHPPLPVMMLLAGVLGIGQAFFGPALTGLLPQIAAPAQLQDANALLGMARSIGQMAGPALAGLLVAAGGAAFAILIDALTYAVSAACLAALDLQGPQAAAAVESMVQQLRLGWYEFRARTWLWIIVLQFAFFHMLVLAPFMVLGAVVAETRLGGGGAWGLVLAAQGLGALAGGLAGLTLRPRRPLAVATIASFAPGPMLILTALPGPLWAIAGAAALGGGGLAIFTVLFDTTLQRKVPPEALSRVSAYDWLGSFALIPIGYALAGPLAQRLGLGGALWLSCVWLVASSSLVLACPAVRRVEA